MGWRLAYDRPQRLALALFNASYIVGGRYMTTSATPSGGSPPGPETDALTAPDDAPDWKVGWTSLGRATMFRTCAATNDAVRRAWSQVLRNRGGSPRLYYDAVILAAVTLASRDPQALAAEVRRIENARYVNRGPRANS